MDHRKPTMAYINVTSSHSSITAQDARWNPLGSLVPSQWCSLQLKGSQSSPQTFNPLHQNLLKFPESDASSKVSFLPIWALTLSQFLSLSKIRILHNTLSLLFGEHYLLSKIYTCLMLLPPWSLSWVSHRSWTILVFAFRFISSTWCIAFLTPVPGIIFSAIILSRS